MMKRLGILAALLVASWCCMTTLHELGHLVGGWAGGGRLLDAELRPWRLPHSLHDPDPHPLVTLWCGPALGVVVPVGVAMVIRRRPVWFVAWFCVLANGLYLAAGWWSGDRHLDTTRLLAEGAPPATIALYCLATIPAGYWGLRREVARVMMPTARQSDCDANDSLQEGGKSAS